MGRQKDLPGYQPTPWTLDALAGTPHPHQDR
jgi:hypothetical protein